MEVTHDFSKSLERGDEGERIFHDCYPSARRVNVKDGKTFYDFIGPKGESIEIKSDGKAWRTNNLFVEVISNENDQSPGGPFRNPSSDWFVYVCRGLGMIFWTRTARLRGFMEEKGYVRSDEASQIELVRKPVKVRNIGRDGRPYFTLGYPVPIVELSNDGVIVQSRPFT